ncbi:MAG: S8 family serine peptidase, partial [Bdellovibrionota bacterium]
MQIHFISALLIGVSMFSSGVSASEFVRGELLIRVSEKGRAAGPAALSALHAKIGAKARSEFKLFQQFQVVKLPAGMSEEQGRKYYESSAAVEYAEPNFIYHTLEVQKDPLFEKQWGLHNTAQNSGKAGADIDALRAWKIERGNHQVVVAVIDSGVEYTHPDLQQNIWTNPHPGANGFEGDVHGWNFVEKNNDPKDDLFHGTHCAGIIGAAHNGIGVMGVAGEVSIMPVRFINASGGGTLEDSIKATEYAILRHSDILSNSWGGDDESQAMLEVIAKANDAGIVYVAAAGNEHNNNDTSPTYPASYNVP